MRLASFLSGGFITAIVVNPPERKLAKRTSVQWKVRTIFGNRMLFKLHIVSRIIVKRLHRGAFCQFLFLWIYYYGSNESTGKKTGKTHLCGLSGLKSVSSKDKVQVIIAGKLYRESFVL